MKVAAHSFLIEKGIKSMGTPICAFIVEKYLIEFAEKIVKTKEQEKERVENESSNSNSSGSRGV